MALAFNMFVRKVQVAWGQGWQGDLLGMKPAKNFATAVAPAQQ